MVVDTSLSLRSPVEIGSGLVIFHKRGSARGPWPNGPCYRRLGIEEVTSLLKIHRIFYEVILIQKCVLFQFTKLNCGQDYIERHDNCVAFSTVSR